MDPQFWQNRWENQQIAFHQEEVNPHLQELWAALDIPVGAPVFVPLCGKSLDMPWLAEQGHPVLGVEISPVAAESLFAELGLTPETEPRGAFTEYRSGRLRVLCGDFFALDPGALQETAFVHDRAALIALPPELRQPYARKMAELLPPGTLTLLITFDYPQAEMNGPPFSVAPPEIEALYSGSFEIELRRELDGLVAHPRFREKGLTRLTERVYILRRRATGG